ncbi:hypothetical protein BX667DRAFT_495627, partial [Coemansia mojavensis]
CHLFAFPLCMLIKLPPHAVSNKLLCSVLIAKMYSSAFKKLWIHVIIAVAWELLMHFTQIACLIAIIVFSRFCCFQPRVFDNDAVFNYPFNRRFRISMSNKAPCMPSKHSLSNCNHLTRIECLLACSIAIS